MTYKDNEFNRDRIPRVVGFKNQSELIKWVHRRNISPELEAELVGYYVANVPLPTLTKLQIRDIMVRCGLEDKYDGILDTMTPRQERVYNEAQDVNFNHELTQALFLAFEEEERDAIRNKIVELYLP